MLLVDAVAGSVVHGRIIHGYMEKSLKLLHNGRQCGARPSFARFFRCICIRLEFNMRFVWTLRKMNRQGDINVFQADENRLHGFAFIVLGWGRVCR